MNTTTGGCEDNPPCVCECHSNSLSPPLVEHIESGRSCPCTIVEIPIDVNTLYGYVFVDPDPLKRPRSPTVIDVVPARKRPALIRVPTVVDLSCVDTDDGSDDEFIDNNTDIRSLLLQVALAQKKTALVHKELIKLIKVVDNMADNFNALSNVTSSIDRDLKTQAETVHLNGKTIDGVIALFDALNTRLSVDVFPDIKMLHARLAKLEPDA